MIERDSEHKSAGQFAWFAAKDARMKSIANASHFTDAQKITAERVKLGLEMVYNCNKVSITYCKKWIRVKVHEGTVRDKKNLALLESDWSKMGFTKVHTDQGIIYHVV